MQDLFQCNSQPKLTTTHFVGLGCLVSRLQLTLEQTKYFTKETKKKKKKQHKKHAKKYVYISLSLPLATHLDLEMEDFESKFLLKQLQKTKLFNKHKASDQRTKMYR